MVWSAKIGADFSGGGEMTNVSQELRLPRKREKREILTRVKVGGFSEAKVYKMRGSFYKNLQQQRKDKILLATQTGYSL